MYNQAIIEQLISLSDLSAAHQFFLLNFDMLLNYSVSIVILGLGLWMFFKNTFSTLVLSLSILVMGVFLIASMEAYNSSLNQRQIDFLRTIDNASIQNIVGESYLKPDITLKDIYHALEQASAKTNINPSN